jgi:hypothetical protein
MDEFLAVAKICAAHHKEDFLKNLVVSLCKFTTLTGNEKPGTAVFWKKHEGKNIRKQGIIRRACGRQLSLSMGRSLRATVVTCF